MIKLKKLIKLGLLSIIMASNVNAQENTFALCTDGIDNDGDGYLDAVDPDCYASGNAPIMACITSAFLVQSSTSQWSSVDLVSGLYETTDDTIPGTINGSGFNVLDYRVWSYYQGANDSRLVVSSQDAISRNWQSYLTPPIPGLPNGRFFVGDCDTTGKLYLVAPNAGPVKFYAVDVMYNSPTYLTTVDSGEFTVVTAFADWAYSAFDHSFYAIDHATHLVKLDVASGVFTDLGPSGIPGVTGPYGADYFDRRGYLYASHNASGQIFRMDLTNPSAPFDSTKTVLFTQGPSSGSNDGSRCLRAGINIDMGDAPETYNTILDSNGARHLIIDYNGNDLTGSMYLGASVNEDIDGQPSVLADSSTDDDGVAFIDILGSKGSTPITIPTYTLSSSFVNNSGDIAWVGAWLDWNSDGLFDESEGITFSIPADSTVGSVDFTWSNKLYTPPSGDYTYARIRITSDTLFLGDWKGAKFAGEVEDYGIMAVKNLALADFGLTLTKNENRVELEWNDGRKDNLKEFVAEVSFNNADNFTEFARMDAENDPNKKYTADYKMKEQGTYFFRVMATPTDGSETYYSGVKYVHNGTPGIKLYPSVVKDEVVIEINLDSDAEVSIITLDGKVLKTITIASNINKIDLSNLTSGMYIIKVNSSDIEQPEYFRIFKQ